MLLFNAANGGHKPSYKMQSGLIYYSLIHDTMRFLKIIIVVGAFAAIGAVSGGHNDPDVTFAEHLRIIIIAVVAVALLLAVNKYQRENS